MAIPKIHCHTQADKSTVLYAKFMWETMRSLANHPDELSLTVHCMGPSAADRFNSYSLPQSTGMVIPGYQVNKNGSMGHGIAVMSALAMTGNEDIHLIVDSDTCVIVKGWDDYIRQKLIIENFGIIGSTYEDQGGICSGAGAVQTYKGIPSVTWCALSPKHDWRTLKVLPSKDHRIKISTKELSETYNLPQGNSVFGEVGWQIPQYLRDHNLTYEGWKQLKPDSGAIVLKGLNNYHEEFHTRGEPFIVHHRGSLRHAFRVDKMSIQFYACVEERIKSIINTTPKWKWDDSYEYFPVYTRDVIPTQQITEIPEIAKPEPVPVNPTETQIKLVKPDGKSEWIKISLNGSVITPRSSAPRNSINSDLNMIKTNDDRFNHIRIEGQLNTTYIISLPIPDTKPYITSCRNATNSIINLCFLRGSQISLAAGATRILLVDIDGAQVVS